MKGYHGLYAWTNAHACDLINSYSKQLHATAVCLPSYKANADYMSSYRVGDTSVGSVKDAALKLLYRSGMT